MRRILVAAALFGIAASPCFACPFAESNTSVAPSTTATAQPTIVPDQGNQTPQTTPQPQQPS